MKGNRLAASSQHLGESRLGWTVVDSRTKLRWQRRYCPACPSVWPFRDYGERVGVASAHTRMRQLLQRGTVLAENETRGTLAEKVAKRRYRTRRLILAGCLCNTKTWLVQRWTNPDEQPQVRERVLARMDTLTRRINDLTILLARLQSRSGSGHLLVVRVFAKTLSAIGVMVILSTTRQVLQVY